MALLKQRIILRCVNPFSFLKINSFYTKNLSNRLLFKRQMASVLTEDYANFETKLSIEQPVQDYIKLIEHKLKADVVVPEKVLAECFERISASVRETVWILLFDKGNKAIMKNEEREKKAVELLREHKNDACFYNPWIYNEWVVTLRDELLRREMYDFWRNHLVRNELGPCWAKDSDLFDDIEDPEPAKFYNFAGCQAPWFEKQAVSSNLQSVERAEFVLPLTDNKEMNNNNIIETIGVPRPDFKTIGIENPVGDYKFNIELQDSINSNDDKVYKTILSEGRNMVWRLLFEKNGNLTPENYEKAAELLEAVKADSCLYRPYDYNDWIPKVRDELMERHYFDFWNNVIVEKKLGLCWYKDCEFFDDNEDTRPLEFYKNGDAIMKAYCENTEEKILESPHQ